MSTGQRGALIYRAGKGDQAARDELAALDHAEQQAATAAALPSAPTPDVAEARAAVAQRYGIDGSSAFLLSADDEAGLIEQAQKIRELDGRGRLQPFAANPGQAAGNGTPPVVTGDSRGRELYRAQKASSRPSWLG